MQSVGAAEAATEQQSWSDRHSNSGSHGRNLESDHCTGNSLPTICEGHHVIFNVHQLMPADGTPVNVHLRDSMDKSPYVLVKHRDDSLEPGRDSNTG